MMDEDGEVLSRLLDGEAVDEARLRNALAQPEAAGLLLQWASLGQLLRADLGAADDAFCDSMRQRLRTPAWRRLLRDRFVPVAVAASLVIAGFLGYGIRWWLEPVSGVAAPEVRSAAAQQRVTRPVSPPPVAPPPSPASSITVKRPRSAVPTPRARVPFVQWRESTLPD